MVQSVGFSIIIPHKNIPKLLDRCLSSIPINQQVQVIIVDDDSDSDRVDFENFPGQRRKYTQVYFTKESKGAGYARNIGLRYATGKWLIFADSDDYFNDCFFPTITKYFDSMADVVYFSATSVDNNTLQPATRHFRTENSVNNYDVNNPKSVEDIKYANWEPWSKMFNHDYIRRNRISFDEVMVGNDLGFVIKAGHLSQRIEVDKAPIYCVTHRKESLTFEDSELAFDNRYKAILRTNRYMKELNKRHYMTPIYPHIYKGIKYGPIKVFIMVIIALKYRNEVLYGSKGYLRSLLNKRNN